jgi:acetyl-CoA/propionyl-CoA carboxylase biotin carboxyl carrier protein
VAEIHPLGNGVFRIADGTRSRIAYAAGRSDARWVFLEGRVYVIEAAQGSGSRAKRTHEHTALAAPMPATVVAIEVETGRAVSRGDVLIVLEAMKMELPIKAPRDGVVRAIACRPGELVQPGVPLVELE